MSADLIDLDTQNPIVLLITRDDPNSTGLPEVGWTVTFSEPVAGVTAGTFTLFNGGLSGSPAITSVTGVGTTWTVKAGTGGGEGTLSLYVNSTSGVTDGAGNPLAGLPVIGPAYNVDHIAPQAAKLNANTLLVADANAGMNGFQITIQYNEPMNQSVNPTVSFPIENPAPSLTFASGQWLDAKTFRANFAVSDLGVELSDIDVRVTGGSDVVGNVQSSFQVGDLFDIDTLNPSVVSIKRADANPTSAATVKYTVTLSQDAGGLDTGNFALNTTGLSGASIVTVTGGPLVYAVDVNTGSGNGTLRLDFANSTGAADLAGNAITGLPFLGESYNVIHALPAKVAGLVVGDGTAQRSTVTSIKVTFDSAVTFTGSPASAFTLTRISDGASVALAAAVSGNEVTLSFTGGAVNGKSLADGRYTLGVLASQFAGGGFDGNGDGTPGDDYTLVGNPTNKLFRLFGDVDGSGQVTSSDFLAFRLAFLSSSAIFDFNGNGTVDSSDFLQFRLRFLQSV
ncbi:MAG: hypothetical protein K1X57_20570 [Gemmataceae bacterium]|nr:hypothetical protein [Gemmataceae bacterium]